MECSIATSSIIVVRRCVQLLGSSQLCSRYSRDNGTLPALLASFMQTTADLRKQLRAMKKHVAAREAETRCLIASSWLCRSSVAYMNEAASSL
jgi:hypothetical protein